MLAYLGKHVESSSDFVFQKLYVQIIRRFSANIYICGDRSCHILQDFNQKIEGAILTEEFQFKTASTCTTYEGWRAVAKVMRPKQCQLTVRLCKPSAYLCAVQSISELVLGMSLTARLHYSEQVQCFQWDFSNVFCYFSQEELIPAVAQHFAAQVWPLRPI